MTGVWVEGSEGVRDQSLNLGPCVMSPRASAAASFMAWAFHALMDGVGLPREAQLGCIAQQVQEPALHSAHYLCCLAEMQAPLAPTPHV